MKRVLLVSVALFAVSLRAAEEKFSSAVRSGDFSAAGLGKLTPSELERLDALVRDFKSGALTAARQEAEAASAARAAAEARALQAEADAKAAQARAESARQEAAKEKESKPGLLARAKVILTPGTQIEYETVESRIAGDFKGWEAHTVFSLENGSRWQVLNGGSYVTPPIPGPKVKIVPASLGGFWMSIEGVNQRVRVAPFGVK
jgi:hypothetical protein